jgi:hypothetical protein
MARPSVLAFHHRVHSTPLTNCHASATLRRSGPTRLIPHLPATRVAAVLLCPSSHANELIRAHSARAMCAPEATMTLLALPTKKLLGSHGVRDLVESPREVGVSGGRVDNIARKAAAAVGSHGQSCHVR